jgi:hypothetical protein
MNDLPTHGLLQQLHSRPVSGEHLELLGQKAAQAWGRGEYGSLTDAVVGTVKEAQLSPEQVKRVVEFTNHSAFSAEFKKEAQKHRIIEFSGGPADPSVVIQDLNDGGSPLGSPSFDDYSSEPSAKMASAEEEDELWGLFKAAGSDIPEENPFAPALDLREKLSAAEDHFTAQISGLETLFAELTDRLYHEVKQASLSGHSLGEVLRVLEAAEPEEVHIKTAFEAISPRLLADGVFDSMVGIGQSLEKTGSARVANPDHPLVTLFGEYKGIFDKYAELYSAREEVTTGLSQIESFLVKASSEREKNAKKGFWPTLVEGAHKAAPAVAQTAKDVGEHVFGSESKVPGAIARGAKTLTEKAPHAIAGVAALRGAQVVNRKMEDPAVQGVLAQVPGTRANKRSEEYERARQQGLV